MATPDGLELVACPLCSGSEHRVLFERRDHIHGVSDQLFKVVRCHHCAFVFVNPRPDQLNIHRFYPDEFYDVNSSAETILEQKRDTLNARLKLVSHLAPGSLLDVGCQKGEFLEVMRRRGWRVQGVEFSTKPPNLFKLPIHYGTLSDAPYAPGSFDAITLWAVLEHVPDPILVLRQIERLLKRDGRAFILVPNFRSIPGRYMRHDDVPRHLVMFTPRTFTIAAQKAGLVPLSWTFGDDVFSGSTRGVLNFFAKRLAGEQMEDILAQNRSPAKWKEFSSYLAGKPSKLMRAVDLLDIGVTPYLDRLVNWLHFGFTMTVEVARSRSSDTECS